MGCGAFTDYAAPSCEGTTEKYGIRADSSGALTLYKDVRTAVCGCVSNINSTTISLAAYILLMEVWKYL